MQSGHELERGRRKNSFRCRHLRADDGDAVQRRGQLSPAKWNYFGQGR
jgi:hypothetical protein